MSSKQISIAIADDHPSVVEGIVHIISDHTPYRIAATITDGTKLLPILNSHAVDLLFLDVKLQDISGLDLARTIKQRFPAIKIIIFSTYEEPKVIATAREIGVQGYLSKSSSASQIIQAMQKVIQGDYSFPQGKKESHPTIAVDSFCNTFTLTKREKEIIRLIGEGMTTKEMAVKLFLSESTVETHRKNIKHKIGVSDPFRINLFLSKYRDSG